MNKIKVSIIVPVYNAEKYLNRCVNSLVNQTLKDIEIILVDDASPDNSPKLCDEFSVADERIKVIHKENEGAGYARNAGLAIASGEFVGFVDSDDYVAENMFEVLYSSAVNNSADMVLSGVSYVGGNIFSGENEYSENNIFLNDTFFEGDEGIKKLVFGIVGAKPEEEYDSRYGMGIWKNIYKRSVITDNNILFMSERKILSEDALFLIDFSMRARKAVGISGVFYRYCRNDDSISKSRKSDRLEKVNIFISEIEKRLKNFAPKDEYEIYLNRLIEGYARVLCSQEIMYSEDNKTGYFALRKNLKKICTDKLMADTLKKYPIFKLPLRQAVFAFLVKYRLYFLQKIIVKLRSR